MVFTREISMQHKIRPGMKSSLRLIISNCLHALLRRNHSCQKKPKIKQGWTFIPGWNKEKKMSKHFISGWKFIMSMLLLNILTHLLNMLFSFNMFYSHKKRNVSLEGSLERVLLAAEFEFSKTSVLKLPRNISNATSECA